MDNWNLDILNDEQWNNGPISSRYNTTKYSADQKKNILGLRSSIWHHYDFQARKFFSLVAGDMSIKLTFQHEHSSLTYNPESKKNLIESL